MFKWPILFALLITVSSVAKSTDVYQVVTSHPHDLEKISPYLKTVQKDGRLWLVVVDESAPTSVFRYLRLRRGEEKTYSFRAIDSLTLSVENDSEVKSFTSRVRSEFIQKDVEELASFKTRYTGTEDNQRALQKVKERFQTLGYSVSETCQSPKACNLVAEKKGTVSDQVILVEAHVDSVGASFAGADDNASGVAVLLEMARVLKDYSNKKTLRFFVTNGEEQGLVGAIHYVKVLTSENRLRDLSLVINMDMVGYNSNGVVELETDPPFEDLAKWFGELANRFTSLKAKITLGAWGSDHVPFLKKNVPAILTIENWDTKTPCYHQKCDTPDTLNYAYAVEIGKLNVAAVLVKDGASGEASSSRP